MASYKGLYNDFLAKLATDYLKYSFGCIACFVKVSEKLETKKYQRKLIDYWNSNC